MTTATPIPFLSVDVAVIGGGAAGLNAAVTLGRARRTVVVVDSGQPRNAPADAVHMFLTRDGMPPADLVRIGRGEVAHYGGRFVDGEATGAHRSDDGFAVLLADGRCIAARRLLVTTGLIDELPDVPGIRELWGKDVHHCPYCHGWELHGRAVGVLGSGPTAVHQALMFRQWVEDLTLFVHTAPVPTPEQSEQLAARGIRVITGVVEALELDNDALTGLRLCDGTVVSLDSLVVGPRMVARSGLLAALGLEPVQHPMGMGEFIASDGHGQTAVPGVWVAGNVTDLTAGVIAAAAAGMMAAAAANLDLIADDTATAVAEHRASLQRVAATGDGHPGATASAMAGTQVIASA
jgi:thioredoxin reductase